jgi:hypothetical protein
MHHNENCPKCGHWGFYDHHCSACGYSNKYTWVWWVIIPLGLWLFSAIAPVFGFGSSVGPRFPWDTDPQEAADIQSDLADIPNYTYDPGSNYDLSAEETAFWLDVSPPDENRAASGCPSGCLYPPPSGCVIKGNISFDTKEKIYHLPSDPFYSQTVINTNYGERWFCTEQEAWANGWRHSLP